MGGGNFSHQQNVWCKFIENIRGSLFVSLFVCWVFFFANGVVSSVWCTSTLKLHQSLIVQNTVINDQNG